MDASGNAQRARRPRPDQITTDEAAALNRQTWDSIRRQRDEGLIAKHHDIAADLRSGTSSLFPEQRELLGDVAGKRMLDLGCGDGMELLQWTQAGASVVGVDNSPRQLAAAGRAADTLGLACQFVLADLLRLPEDLRRGEFDIVFSSWVTAWIGDLDRWFGGAYRALRPGGALLLTGSHPLSNFFGEQRRGHTRRPSYFAQGPFIDRSDGRSPEWNPAGDRRTSVEWSPTLGALVTSVAQTGLRITHLVEAGDATEKTGLPEGYPGRFTLRAVKD